MSVGMALWALITFSEGKQPELGGMFESESKCLRAAELAQLLSDDKKAACFVMVQHKVGIEQ